MRLLRGVVAYFRQDAAGAIRELEQAVELVPDSVAARALLAISYVDNVQFERYEQVMLEMQRLPPSSPEDFLFKGVAQAALFLEDGLPLMDQAIQQRPSNIAYLLRAEAR